MFVTLQNMLVFYICLCYFKEVFKTPFLIENLILWPFEIDFMFLPINFHWKQSVSKGHQTKNMSILRCHCWVEKKTC